MVEIVFREKTLDLNKKIQKICFTFLFSQKKTSDGVILRSVLMHKIVGRSIFETRTVNHCIVTDSIFTYLTVMKT